MLLYAFNRRRKAKRVGETRIVIIIDIKSQIPDGADVLSQFEVLDIIDILEQKRRYRFDRIAKENTVYVRAHIRHRVVLTEDPVCHTTVARIKSDDFDRTIGKQAFL